MEKNFKRTLVTTALPYANGPVHIGHLAGVYVPADIYTRYLRLKGENVVMIGGSDEHGVPITLKAKAEGITPQDVVDRYHNIIKKSFEDFGIYFDIYSGLLLRYTVKRHRTSSVNYMIKANSSKKPLYNIMTKKQNNSWQTAILQELVPIVRTKELTETNVKLAEPPLMRRILLTLNLQ